MTASKKISNGRRILDKQNVSPKRIAAATKKLATKRIKFV